MSTPTFSPPSRHPLLEDDPRIYLNFGNEGHPKTDLQCEALKAISKAAKRAFGPFADELALYDLKETLAYYGCL